MNVDFTLINRLPPLSRARGDRLYQHGEKWWVDLFKENGAYLWGRRPEGVAHEWKNQLDKGLGGLIPSLFDQRLARHLAVLFSCPHRAVFFRNHERAMAALEAALGRSVSFQAWHDPALGDFSTQELAYWRPYLQLPQEASVVYPLLPWSQTQARILLFTKSYQGTLPQGDLVPATELSALTRSVVLTLRDLADTQKKRERESFWAVFDKKTAASPLFQRKGPYLYPLCAPEAYEDVFQRFLDAGFLLSPDMSIPSILPQGLSNGEWKAFLDASREE